MRHYGAPTRLLDFTKSPYVAAFFATVDAGPDKCAAIWAIDGFEVKRQAGTLLSESSFSAILRAIGEKALKDPDFSFSDSRVFKEVFEGGTGGVPARVVMSGTLACSRTIPLPSRGNRGPAVTDTKPSTETDPTISLGGVRHKLS
jgi:hypothetical protein